MQRPLAVRSRARFTAAGFLAYTVMAVAYTYPLITHLGTGFLHGIDYYDSFQQAWVVAWVQHALLTNPLSLYDAPIFYPTKSALAYIDTMLPAAILLLPARLITHNSAVIYNLAVVTSFPMCATCMYLWADRLIHDARGSFLAGLIYAYCPYRLRHIEHLNLLSAECIPLTLLCFEIVRTRGGKLAWLGLGASLVLGAVTSLYYAAFGIVALALYAAVLRWRGQLLLSIRALRDAWPLLPSLLLLTAGVWFYMRVMSTSFGPRRLEDMVFFAADVRDFLHVGPQNPLLGWSDQMWRLPPTAARQYLFPGFVALGLAIFACRGTAEVDLCGDRVKSAAPSVARTLVIVAALVALLSLGPYLKLFGTFSFGPLEHVPLPYLLVYELLPPLRGLRDVGRYDQVAMAFLAAAAGLGLARLLSNRRPSTARLLFVGLICLVVAEYWSVQRPLIPVQSGAAIPPIYTWLDRQPAGIALELPVCDTRLPWNICTEEFPYMYYQTYHWHPLVNGWAGSYPSDWFTRAVALESFPSDRSWPLIKQFGVRYVIIHPDFPGLAGTASWLNTPADRKRHAIQQVVRLGNDEVVVLAQG
jgi:hypothetical protein